MGSTPRWPNSSNLAFVENLYEQYLKNPSRIPRAWREYFQLLTDGEQFPVGWAPHPAFETRSLFHSRVPGPGWSRPGATEMAALQDRVDQLVRAYRVRGHLVAQLDPLGLPRPAQPELDPAFHSLTEAHMEKTFSSKSISGTTGTLSLRRILQRLRNTYCRFIGVQFMHIDDLAVKTWLQERMEGTENHIELGHSKQVEIFTKLTDSVIFEEFLQRKFLGAKSFSLEGAESLIPLLSLALEKAGEHGLNEVVIGMAHRGRLNVLANIMGKHPRRIFREFEDRDFEQQLGRGDVKYHLGYSNDCHLSSGHKMHLSLCFNPSHLEFVDPVAIGRMRAKQDRYGDRDRVRGMTLLIHGDAAFAGEGIVQETLNLSQLSAYRTGGTLHVIVNNQIGFTTAADESRSSTYATDVAKMLQVPIFHVNGEDPEAVAQVIHLAMDFRHEFQRDVVVDMYCYRRRGHNEGDEPSFTQPLLYQAIDRRPPVREGYLEHLLRLGEITSSEAADIEQRRRQFLEAELQAARDPESVPPTFPMDGVWLPYRGGSDADVATPDTGVPREKLCEYLRALTRTPEGFSPHPKIRRWLEQRLSMADGERPLDWSAGESLAFASLAAEGVRLRLSGQDSERGTFSHRHAMLHDVFSGTKYMPLQHVTEDQAPVEICNSPLSEAAVLGFEYGYSLDAPDALVIWEAQFGDFCNAAQVIIDQFLCSAEDKWNRLSGIVLFLPHGFEGMGPEHSSARLERFLMLAAEDNIQIAQPSTPAQLFHLLRRQIRRPIRKPLVVMTPKSLLRHPQVVADLAQLEKGAFQRVLADAAGPPPDRVNLALLCSGRVYYDLDQRRRDAQRGDVMILRLEQLYPLGVSEVLAPLQGIPSGTPVRWVQDEPENMGPWRYIKDRFGDVLRERFEFQGVHRAESASPATGSPGSHRIEQERLMEAAFAPPTTEKRNR